MMKPAFRQACHLATTLLFAGVLLNGCGPTPPSSVTSADTKTTTGTSAADDTARVQSLLAQAAKSSGAEAQKLKLDAAEILIRNKRSAIAKNLLAEMNPQTLSGENLGRHSLLSATLALAKGKTENALRILDNPRLLQQADGLPIAMQIGLSDKRARALAQKGNHVASAQERIFTAPLLTDKKQIEKNQRAIWKSMSFLSVDELNSQLAAISERTGSPDYRGWLELMLVYKNGSGIDTQLAKLNGWIARWPHHPAARQLPQDLAILRDIAAHQPRRIALLLPLGGREQAVSDAIRDGFMAAYFQGAANDRPEIRFYDTNADGNFAAVYQRAVSDGAEAVIGPLLKEHVKALQAMPQLPVPTLALNALDDGSKAPANLYQFGLSLNEEAAQVADTAQAEQHKRAVIVGVRTDWATRATDSFKAQWNKGGGSVVDEIWFQPAGGDFATSIERMLAVDESRQRGKDIQRIIGRNARVEPRRRQDIDIIFYVGKADQARSIKPMMTYYYADSIPVYATSSIYSGMADPARDQDLDGILFPEIPWVLDDSDSLKQAVTGSRGNSPFIRLSAMGTDAFRLFPRLRQMELFPDTKLQGATGELWLDKQRTVHRRLAWAQFQQGLAKPATVVPGIVDEATMQDAIDANSTLEQPEQRDW
jgi:outer membrane PBP1 activator LpoA protein